MKSRFPNELSICKIVITYGVVLIKIIMRTCDLG